MKNIIQQRNQLKIWTIVLTLIGIVFLHQNAINASFKKNQALLYFLHYSSWQTVGMDVSSAALELNMSTLQKAIFLQPDNPTLGQSLGLLQFLLGNLGEALSTWESIAVEPKAVMTIQGNYALSISENESALFWFTQAVTRDASYAMGWHNIGELQELNGDWKSARDAYETAVLLGFAASVHPLCQLLRDHGDREKALVIWNTALDQHLHHPERLLWWQGLNNSLRALGLWETGLQQVNKGLAEYPTDPILHVEKGALLYGSNGDVTQAMSAINQAIALEESLAIAYSTAGSIYADEEENAIAYEWYSQAIARDNSIPSWHITRGHLARISDEFQTAKEAFEIAIDQFPEFFPAYLGLARTYQDMGDNESAVLWVDKALLISQPEDIQTLLLVGDIYYWGGKSSQAIDAFEAVIRQDATNKVAQQILHELRND